MYESAHVRGCDGDVDDDDDDDDYDDYQDYEATRKPATTAQTHDGNIMTTLLVRQ